MKIKSVTIPLSNGRAVTLSLWKNLSVAKISHMNVLLGFEVAKNIRLNAMERVDTVLITVGPLGLTYSRMYWRKEV